jgi:hypothetical protein
LLYFFSLFNQNINHQLITNQPANQPANQPTNQPTNQDVLSLNYIVI